MSSFLNDCRKNDIYVSFVVEYILQLLLQLTCTEEFKNLQGHTLCMTDDSGVSRSGITPVDKLMITRYHNDLRSSVMPPAEDLMLLVSLFLL